MYTSITTIKNFDWSIIFKVHNESLGVAKDGHWYLKDKYTLCYTPQGNISTRDEHIILKRN